MAWRERTRARKYVCFLSMEKAVKANVNRQVTNGMLLKMIIHTIHTDIYDDCGTKKMKRFNFESTIKRLFYLRSSSHIPIDHPSSIR